MKMRAQTINIAPYCYSCEALTMELNCISDGQKNILIKALQEREAQLDTLIDHHREDIEHAKSKLDIFHTVDLTRELRQFERERDQVNELVKAIDLAPSCRVRSPAVTAVEDMEVRLEEAKRQFMDAGNKATGKRFIDVEAREDRMGYFGIYGTTGEGEVYSPYYNQSENWAEDIGVDPEDIFKEEWALITLAGASDWEDWEWVLQ